MLTLSRRACEDARQTTLIRQAWNDSGRVYGYRKLHDDLLDQGETCCPNRVARLTKLAGIKAQIGYRRRPSSHSGRPSLVIDNTLARQFDVEASDRVWVNTSPNSHHGRVCLPCSRTRPLFASCGGLVDAEPLDHGCGAAGAPYGYLATKAQKPGADPLGSGQPVYQHGLDCLHTGSQSGTLDEPPRQLPRQCCSGKFFLIAQARAHPASNLQNAPGSPTGRV